jgi:hypothetical protein
MDNNLLIALAEGTTFDEGLSLEEAKEVKIDPEIKEVTWVFDDQPYSYEYKDKPYELSIEDFYITDLEGIENYKNIQHLTLPSSTIKDLKPLLALSKLERLCIGIVSESDLSILSELPNLKRVFINGKVNNAQREVLKELKEKQIQIDILNELTFNSQPFKDPILKLAVINQLVVMGELKWPNLYPFDDYSLDMYNLNRVLDVDLKADLLDKIEELFWTGGGLDIHHILYPQWDGETEEYDITYLKGIENLNNLKSFTLEQYDMPKDASNFEHLFVKH